MGLFGGYQNAGPGIDPNAPKKKPFFRFWELLRRNFGKILTVNLIYMTLHAPLLLAGLHLAFAFPFVQKIIRLFGVVNTPLLIGTSAVCFLAFALFYVFVYRATAKAYYSIVSSAEV